MIDLHTHILPGIDDGAGTMAESVEIARAALADGIELVAATPHVRDDYPTSAETMERRVTEIRAALEGAGIPLDVRTGGEIALDRLPILGADELRRFGLGGSDRYLLLEFPYYAWPLPLGKQIADLRALGVTPVLAHPERNPAVQSSPERLGELVAGGAIVQVTAASLDGRLGRRAQKTGFDLVEQGLAHMVASDAHTPGVRAVGLSAAAEAIGDRGLAAWLTRDVPAAVVAGEEVPPRPETGRRGRRWFRR